MTRGNALPGLWTEESEVRYRELRKRDRLTRAERAELSYLHWLRRDFILERGDDLWFSNPERREVLNKIKQWRETWEKERHNG